MSFKRYLTIYAALWRNSVAREMSFKGNFILWIVVELLWFGLQLCFVEVVFSQTSTVGTWTQWQMVLLVGARRKFTLRTFMSPRLIEIVPGFGDVCVKPGGGTRRTR